MKFQSKAFWLAALAKVIFDYSRGRIILEKNQHFNEPYKYDASGLFLATEGRNFETLKVLRARVIKLVL
jgi:hypothetical protein